MLLIKSSSFFLIDMMMEMVLNEQKAKENNIDIDECYEKVDHVFEKRGFSTMNSWHIFLLPDNMIPMHLLYILSYRLHNENTTHLLM